MQADFDGVLGQARFFIWSKENELWRSFFRTTVGGHWSEEDVDEFMKCGYYYEIHLDHKYEGLAHTFCLSVLERSNVFKAAKISKLAVNNTKVLVLLGKNKSLKEKIAKLASQCGFELARIRTASDDASANENESRSKFRHYLQSLAAMFAPSVGERVKAKR